MDKTYLAYGSCRKWGIIHIADLFPILGRSIHLSMLMLELSFVQAKFWSFEGVVEVAVRTGGLVRCISRGKYAIPVTKGSERTR